MFPVNMYTPVHPNLEKHFYNLFTEILKCHSVSIAMTHFFSFPVFSFNKSIGGEKNKKRLKTLVTSLLK